MPVGRESSLVARAMAVWVEERRDWSLSILRGDEEGKKQD
jgi:hypothetical protein